MAGSTQVPAAPAASEAGGMPWAAGQA